MLTVDTPVPSDAPLDPVPHDPSASSTPLPPYKHTCRVYGDITITEPCLLELLYSKPVQRLARVSQHGISCMKGLTPDPPVSRLEHSIGAAILVRKAGADLETQAAALLHDIAHTALSHVIDGVWGRVVHESDKFLYLEQTELPALLSANFPSPQRILNENLFPLVEQDSPRLCADRSLDYGLRDAVLCGFLDSHQVKKILEELTVYDNFFAMKSVETARTLADAYMNCDKSMWANYTHSTLYSLTADVIRLAHERGVVKYQDLWKTDEEFWSLLESSSDPDIQKSLSYVKINKVKRIYKEEEASLSADVAAGKCKIVKKIMKTRTIDPDIVMKDSETGKQVCKLLSECDPEYARIRREYIKSKDGEVMCSVYF